MSVIQPKTPSRPTWFVGASFGGTDDQSSRFISEGVWENGYQDQYIDLVQQIQPGDRIAIKAAYTRMNDLPFHNRGLPVSVMSIKAVGTVTENLSDGRRLRVDWQRVDPPREWYFSTYQRTVWKVQPGSQWVTDALIAFTFDRQQQDIEKFLAMPRWANRYKAVEPGQPFAWTRFYEQLADRLLEFKNDRARLVAGLHEMAQRVDALGYLNADQFPDGSTGFVRDICPFTVMGAFNRGTTDANRRVIASELANFLGVTEAVPNSFEGIPVLNNLKSWFFPYEVRRDANHIDALWEVFASALELTNDLTDLRRDAFAKAFDHANGRRGVAWNLTMGLYWVRPQNMLSLDHNSRAYIENALRIKVGLNGPRRRCNASDYLEAMDSLERIFQQPDAPVHTFTELSLEAWRYRSTSVGAPAPVDTDDDDEAVAEVEIKNEKPEPPQGLSVKPYTIADLTSDGCFLAIDEIERLLSRLRSKKNLILQGPPGTGKTWLAKRLGYLLIGWRDDSKLRAVQFHANLSYEDFVRGFRPSADGRLAVEDGVFMQAVVAALGDPTNSYVVVIEEVNRGNPAQVFGELLTLLECSKRQPSDALELSHPGPDGRRQPVYIPPNLHVIGTMNLADRSLALVDLALRRRFAFVTLQPRFDATWRRWVTDHRGVDSVLADDIAQRLIDLNLLITRSDRLGEQFQVGHSYLTPEVRLKEGETRAWFCDVVETEIGPLLEEYWFDAPEQARKAREQLLLNW